MAKRKPRLLLGDEVEVTSAPDHYGLRRFVGKKGRVAEYTCGSRMWVVRFENGVTMSFRRCEIKKVEGSRGEGGAEQKPPVDTNRPPPKLRTGG